jgi:cobalt-zinc-cadmium efflux system membrane fusion protein
MMPRAIVGTSVLVLCGALGACHSEEKFDPAAGAPPVVKVEEVQDPNLLKVDHPEHFPLVPATACKEKPALNVTGVIAPDVSRTIPVISLASGRVIGIYAQLGDDVKAGQLLMRIQSSDIAGALADFAKAKADEQLIRSQLNRSQLLYDRGALAAKDLEMAKDAEQKAKVDLQTASEHVRILGADPERGGATVELRAPVSGTIVEQNVTNAAGVKTLDNSPNLFTIADLSRVWVLCDVYENDLGAVRIGDTADIRLNAYSDKVFHARVSNIGRVLDPNTRTAKVRLEVANPGLMRAGMFLTATFYGLSTEIATAVPTTAILHLHDRDWVFVPSGNGEFRRTEVVAGNQEPDGLQMLQAGLSPGQRVVQNALQLTSAAQQ